LDLSPQRRGITIGHGRSVIGVADLSSIIIRWNWISDDWWPMLTIGVCGNFSLSRDYSTALSQLSMCL